MLSPKIQRSLNTRATCRIPAKGAGPSKPQSKKLCPRSVTAALYVRFRSRQQHTFAEKMLPLCGKSSADTWKLEKGLAELRRRSRRRRKRRAI